MAEKSALSEISNYYNSNTDKFLKSGRKKEAGAIHRKLFPVKQLSDYEAAMYSNKLLLTIIKKNKSKKILDLGCGVGGTIRYLKKKYNADYSGITLSSIQTEISQSLGTSVETADYLDTDWYRKRGSFDLIYAIESLQHNPDHEKLCRNLKLVSDSGTEIVVIDDFIIGNMRKSRSALFFKKMFIKHWHAYGFIDINEFSAVFEKHNFRLIEQQNLSEYMKRNIFLDFLAGPAALAAIIFPFKNPYIDNIIGGQSLKKLQTEGYSGYYKLVFRYN